MGLATVVCSVVVACGGGGSAEDDRLASFLRAVDRGDPCEVLFERGNDLTAGSRQLTRAEETLRETGCLSPDDRRTDVVTTTTPTSVPDDGDTTLPPFETSPTTTDPDDTAPPATDPTAPDGTPAPAPPDEPVAEVAVLAALPRAETEPVARVVEELYRPRRWPDPDGDCRSVSTELLVARSTESMTFIDDRGCFPETGRWVDPWTGVVEEQAGQVVVEHIVPLLDVHRSGGATWSAQERIDYGEGIEDPDGLAVVTVATSDDRAGRAPDQWLPADPQMACGYARAWVRVKARWELTVTTPEADALAAAMAGCPDGTT